MNDHDKPRWSPRDGQVLRTKTIRFIDEFPPGGVIRTFSRAGLNGMKALGLNGNAILRLRMTRLIDEFPPGGVIRTFSRAGLNGMEAIERGRRAGGSAEPA
jgi:hypothetical protein